MKLDIDSVTLHTLEQLGPMLRQIAKRDTDLARQLRRSSSSVYLNLTEARYSQGKKRNSLYYVACASAAEARATIKLAAVWRYVSQSTATHLDSQFDRIVAMLYRLARAK